MEQMPRLMYQLLEQLEQLNKEVAELKAELKSRNAE